MPNRIRPHLLVAVGFVIGAFTIDWFINGEGSPLSEYFLWHVGIPNLWRRLNIIPGIVSAIVAGNIHGGDPVVFYIGFVAQWMTVGLVISLLFSSIRTRPPPYSSIIK